MWDINQAPASLKVFCVCGARWKHANEMGVSHSLNSPRNGFCHRVTKWILSLERHTSLPTSGCQLCDTLIRESIHSGLGFWLTKLYPRGLENASCLLSLCNVLLSTCNPCSVEWSVPMLKAHLVNLGELHECLYRKHLEQCLPHCEPSDSEVAGEETICFMLVLIALLFLIPHSYLNPWFFHAILLILILFYILFVPFCFLLPSFFELHCWGCQNVTPHCGFFFR